MRKPASIPQYFLRTLLQYVGLGFFLLVLVSLAVSFFLTREQAATDLRDSALATANAFRDRIIDGDARVAETQIRQLLKLGGGESAQILKPDLSRVYESFAPIEKIRPCPKAGLTCFDGYFGKARILVPISMGGVDGPAYRYLYLSKQIQWNWEHLVTLFTVFALGYLGLLLAFLRVAKLASHRLSTEIGGWASRLKANPKDSAPVLEPPFAELSPLREALQGLNSQIEKFEKTAKDKARLLLLRGIAHDLLTPVARLQLYISSLESGIDREANADTLSEIRDSLNLVTGIASQVKTLNDLDAPVEETELVEAAHQEIRSLRSSAALEGKDIQLEFRSTLSKLISPFSRTEVARILLNLVQNAAHASERGSVVNIEVGQSERGPFLAVSDRGCGIPEDARERVFDPDFTLKPGTGTGLGLAIVKYICERRSAQVDLQTQVNAGTTVTIHLPAVGGGHA